MVWVQWEERESYEKPMREAKTTVGSPNGGGDSVGLAEAMKIRPWISSFQEREFLWNKNLGSWSEKRIEMGEIEACGSPAWTYDVSIFWSLNLIYG